MLSNPEPGHSETTHDYTITIDGEDRVYTFTSDERFMKDMEFICIMFITRGTAFAKISAKSTQVMVDIFNVLKTKYNINTTKRTPGKPLDFKIITIPRIAACFPNYS